MFCFYPNPLILSSEISNPSCGGALLRAGKRASKRFGLRKNTRKIFVRISPSATMKRAFSAFGKKQSVVTDRTKTRHHRRHYITVHLAVRVLKHPFVWLLPTIPDAGKFQALPRTCLLSMRFRLHRSYWDSPYQPFRLHTIIISYYPNWKHFGVSNDSICVTLGQLHAILTHSCQID